MSKTRAQYLDPQAENVENYCDSVYGQAVSESNVFDSAKAQSVSASILGDVEGMKAMPSCIKDVMACLQEEDHSQVLDAIQYGMGIYEREHGVLPTADVIMSVCQQAVSATKRLDSHGRIILDSVGSTSHHDQISAQANRIVVAITSGLAEAIPFATYLPTDIGSNEAKLGIVSHLSGSNFGGYVQNELMDGVNIGKTFLAAERRVTATIDGPRTAAAGAVTTQEGSGSTVPVLRGRTIVLLNGFPCAYENPNTAATAANSPITGSITIASTTYTIGGTMTVATGVFALTFSPALGAGITAEVEAFIDYEASPTLAPRILTQVSTYSLYATPWRALTDQTIDSKTQYGNELGLDLQSENLMAVRNQFSTERHYASLKKLLALAINNAQTYAFDWAGQKQDKTRAKIWQDAMAVIGVVDQQMAEDTMDHGISHMYVTKTVMAQMQSLPPELFISSGIQVRPGIFRVGRLFGRYEVYYTPKILSENIAGGTAQILCIGRSTQVARCPVVLGDAVSPTYMPLGMLEDMKYRQGFYARTFTSVNPHVPSAKGAALISITGLV